MANPLHSRPEAPQPIFSLSFLPPSLPPSLFFSEKAIENAGHAFGARQPSGHRTRQGRWLDSRQVENYVNVCSNNKMRLN